MSLPFATRLLAGLCLSTTVSAAFAQWSAPTFSTIRNDRIHAQRATVADVDRDGRPDLLTPYSFSDLLQVEFNAAAPAPPGTFTPTIIDPEIVAMQAVAADFDGDGDTDLAAVGLFDRDTGFNTPGVLRWYEQVGDPRLPTSWVIRTLDATTIHWRGLVVGNWDGDALEELVAISSGDSLGVFPGVIRRYYGGGPAPTTRLTQVQTIDAAPGNPEFVALAQLGGAVPDVVTTEPAAGRVVRYRTTPGAPGWTREVVADVATVRAARASDWNADGTVDLVYATLDDCSGVGEIGWLSPPPVIGTPWTRQPLAAVGGIDIVLARADGDLADDIVALQRAGDGGCVAPTSTLQFLVRTPPPGTQIAATYSYLYTTQGPFPAVSVVPIDVDADSDVDFVTTSYGGGSVDLWRNENPANVLFGDGFEG